MSIHIACKDVSVAYAQNGQVEYALRNLTITIPRGQWVAIVGTNGSGQSTLGRVLSGLCPISRGDASSPQATRAIRSGLGISRPECANRRPNGV